MPYIGTSPSNAVRRVHTYTATASQTTFTGASSEGVTLSYADTNYIDVFQNGVLLGSADYTSTSGTSVVLAQGASADDLIVIVVYDVFSVADTVSKSSGGSFDSGVTMASTLNVTGDLTVDTSTLKVDSSNNRVGVGTASPSTTLTVVDDASIEGSSPTLALADTDVSNNKVELSYDEFLTIDIDPNNARGNSGLIIKGDGNERMRIDSSGNVGIGTNSPGSFNTLADNLVVGTTSGENGITIATGSGNSARFVFSDNNTSSSDAFVGAIEYSHGSNSMMFYNSGTQRMVIETNGDVKNSTGTYGTISDENLKENISDASSQWEDIKKLQVRKYSMKADNLDSADKIGVIAQELEKSGMNGLVSDTEWADPNDILKKEKVKSVKYSILYMKAVKALQEAMTRIETLEADVKALKG